MIEHSHVTRFEPGGGVEANLRTFRSTFHISIFDHFSTLISSTTLTPIYVPTLLHHDRRSFTHPSICELFHGCEYTILPSAFTFSFEFLF